MNHLIERNSSKKAPVGARPNIWQPLLHIESQIEMIIFFLGGGIEAAGDAGPVSINHRYKPIDYIFAHGCYYISTFCLLNSFESYMYFQPDGILYIAVTMEDMIIIDREIFTVGVPSHRNV